MSEADERFEAERLRILAKVSAGELTPQQGSLEIAMLKTAAGGLDGPATDNLRAEYVRGQTYTDVGVESDGEQDAPGQQAARETAQDAFNPYAALGVKPPSKWMLATFLLVPFLVLGAIVTIGLTFFLALPAYVVMTLWNDLARPRIPGAIPIGFFQTLAILVATSLVLTVLRWRRKVQIFVKAAQSGQGVNFSASWRSPQPGGQKLQSGDRFGE